MDIPLPNVVVLRQNAAILSSIMQNVVMIRQNAVRLSGVMKIVILLKGIMLSVVVMNVIETYV